MKVAQHEFSLKVNSAVVTAKCASYRPPTWPPARDWPVVVDRKGNVVSRWGDPRWDLTPWAGAPRSLNFGDAEGGRGGRIDAENADLLRLAIGYLTWGPHGLRTASTIATKFAYLRCIFVFCSHHGISAAALMRFPKVLELLPSAIAPSAWKPTLTLFHRLYDAREALGFAVLDTNGLRRLSQAAADHEHIQTPYIPPRIWTYQLGRLRECLDDFLAHREQIEACFKFCLEHYIENYGSLTNALKKGKDATKGPFTKNSARRPGCTYLGPFPETSARFGIDHLLSKWIFGGKAASRLSMFSAYLSLVTIAGLAYIANFTLQRKEETASLRCSCLIWEHDEKLGRVPIIRGATTKTDSDSDARWVASPSVEVAVTALSTIARLRMLCDAVNPRLGPTEDDCADPFLNTAGTEPWGYSKASSNSYDVRDPLDPLTGVMEQYPLLFSKEQLKIRSDDLKIARQLTPNLPEDTFAVGNVWPLAWHQYRRTGAVNMFASGVISDSSMQQQMKHLTRLMPLYYGRGHTRLRLNEEVEQAVVAAMYEVMAHRLKSVVSDRFVSPHSPERKDAIAVNVLSAKDLKTLASWAMAGKVSFRENRLGGCMKSGPCEYGGMESIARCGGGDGGKPCTDVLFDRKKAGEVRIQLLRITGEMENLATSHPRYAALDSERQAMENYLNVVTAGG